MSSAAPMPPGAHHGETVQNDPVQSTLKAPGTNKRLKPTYDNLLSSFAFKFNLRCYIVPSRIRVGGHWRRLRAVLPGLRLRGVRRAGAYTRPL